jgi:phosphoribosylaminoimidazole-succinocarboxamide synthase
MLSNVEKQRAFRKRMSEKGYQRKQIWVLRDAAPKNVKMDKETFRRKLDELTVSFGGAKLTKLYAEVIAFVKSKKEEYEAKGR